MFDAKHDISSKNNCHADSPEMSYEDIRKRLRNDILKSGVKHHKPMLPSGNVMNEKRAGL
jgi:hypothetical protein